MAIEVEVRHHEEKPWFVEGEIDGAAWRIDLKMPPEPVINMVANRCFAYGEMDNDLFGYLMAVRCSVAWEGFTVPADDTPIPCTSDAKEAVFRDYPEIYFAVVEAVSTEMESRSQKKRSSVTTPTVWRPLPPNSS